MFYKFIILIIFNIYLFLKLINKIIIHIFLDSDKNTLPTMGFHIVSLKYKTYTVKIYDIGGSSQIRSLWPKYYNSVSN